MRRSVVGVFNLPPQGRPGVAGATGPAGKDGTAGGYGQIRWADTHVDPEDYFAANARQQLVFVPDPAQTQDVLVAPFKNAVSWTNNRIVVRPNSRGDWQDVVISLLVTPQFAGGGIYADLDVGTAAPVSSGYYSLRGSGASERVSFRLGTQTLDGALANGIRIFLTGTVPFVVQSEAVLYKPDRPSSPP